MTNMNWIETAYTFPVIDRETETYLEDYPDSVDQIRDFHFSTIPELKALLADRPEAAFSEKEKLETAKTAFRNRPKQEAPDLSNVDRQVVDFIYQF